MRSGIYKITNKQTARFYIGSTNDINKRWEDHKRDLRAGTHINPKLQHAWNFYGEENFIFELIETVEPNPKLLLEREQHYLDVFRPYERTIGYNICPTTGGGDNFTNHPDKELIREKLREMYSGENNPMFGRKHSKKSIKQQKEKAIGRYTLEWFVERHGRKLGEEKFQERSLMLSQRDKKCFSHCSNMPTFKGRKHSKNLEEKRQRTKEYFKNHWDEFVELIKSNKYTQRQLSKILSIPRITIRTWASKIGK